MIKTLIELTSFFDKNMKQKENYNHGIESKTFTLVNLYSSGKVSSEEIIRTFFYIEDE